MSKENKENILIFLFVIVGSMIVLSIPKFLGWMYDAPCDSSFADPCKVEPTEQPNDK